MAAEKRKSRASVKNALFEEAYGFNFFKAISLLEGFHTGKGLGKNLSPANDPVRFRVNPGFSFPASDIAAVRRKENGRAPEADINFMGLIGPKGVLPDWYNEYAQELNRKKDFSFTDFLNLFHHRLISLFYLAWKKYRLTENYEAGGNDPISMALGAFSGTGRRERDADPDFFRNARRRLLYFSGLVSRNIPTASTIESVVAHATGVRTKVEQFIERRIPIHDSDRSCLGRNNSTLKKDALCGGRIRDITSCFRVDLGPMSWKKYLALQPRSRNLAMVKKLIAYVAGVEYEFEINLILKGPEIPSLRLGGRKSPPILGRTVMLKRAKIPYPHNVTIATRRDGGVWEA